MLNNSITTDSLFGGSKDSSGLIPTGLSPYGNLEATVIQILINYEGKWNGNQQDGYIWLPGDNAEWIAISVDENNLTIEVVVDKIFETLELCKMKTELRLSYLPGVDICSPCPIYIRNSPSLRTYISFGDSRSRHVLHVENIKSYDVGVHNENNDDTIVVGSYGNHNFGLATNVVHHKENDCGFDVDVVTNEVRDEFFNCILIPNDFNPAQEKTQDAIEEHDDCDNTNTSRAQSPHLDFHFSDQVRDENQNLILDGGIGGNGGDGDNGGDETYSFTDGSNLSVGQEFNSKNEVQNELIKISLSATFEMRVLKSTKTFYYVRCITKKCSWKVRATQKVKSTRFSIRSYCNTHTCDLSDRRRKHRQATAALVADVLLENFRGQQITPAPKSIITMMQNRGVDISYYKAWKGKLLALNQLRGDPEESYKIMPAYLHMVKQINKDTVTHLELDSVGRFRYMFMALGACINGFRKMRKVIAIDGTFLKAKYRGVLLVATAQDGDSHQYPIAWGVVDKENEASWTWFLQKLQGLIPDDFDLVIISDRHASIINAVANLYERAHHVHCLWHLSQNIKQVVKGTGGIDLFMQTANAYKVSKFNSLYKELTKRYPSVTDYLEKSTSPDKWSKAHSLGARYNIMTTNGVESINARLKMERELPIIALLDAILKVVSSWFNKHRNAAEAAMQRTSLTPFAEEVVRDNFTLSQSLKATQLDKWKYLVSGGKIDEIVDFYDYSCSCKKFQLDKLPCAHAIAAMDQAKLTIYELCTPCYTSHMWYSAYADTIYPVPHSSEWIIPSDVSNIVVLPPNVERKRGRAQLQRIPSVGEFRRKNRKKCSICGESGHYKSKCKRSTA